MFSSSYKIVFYLQDFLYLHDNFILLQHLLKIFNLSDFKIFFNFFFFFSNLFFSISI
jgi:hypothetical protein